MRGFDMSAFWSGFEKQAISAGAVARAMANRAEKAGAPVHQKIKKLMGSTKSLRELEVPHENPRLALTHSKALKEVGEFNLAHPVSPASKRRAAAGK